MKKVFAVVILVAITLSLFTGCQEAYDPDKLYTELPSKEVCKEMYLLLLDMGEAVYSVNYTNFNSDYSWYYGTINDCIIAFGAPGNFDTISYVNVANCKFEYGKPFKIFAYRNGEACELQEAYERGWLTEDHIKQLEQRHVELVEEIRKGLLEAFGAGAQN